MKKNHWIRSLLVPEGKLREAMELYPGKTREEIKELVFYEVRKRIRPGIIAAVFLVILAFLSGKEKTEDGILRPVPGTAGTILQVQLNVGQAMKQFPLEIGALEYEKDRIEELHQEAISYLEEVVPGENEGFAKITMQLVFPETLPETGGKISWTTDTPWLVTYEGEVLNEDLQDETEVEIKAEISYGSEVRYFNQRITVCPAVYTEEEAILREVQKELMTQEEESRTRERFILPKTVLGYSVEPAEEPGIPIGAFLVLLAVVVPVLLYSGYFSSLDTRRKERKELAEDCYTEFVTKFSILLAAGSSVRQAFVRLSEEYERNYGQQHVLAAELKVTRQELENGCSEPVAYEALGRRIGVLAYRRMAALLTQNVSKGVQGIRGLLVQEAKEVMAQDRAIIRQKGEQAGTKLLLPMMGILVLVFAILLVPAFQSF